MINRSLFHLLFWLVVWLPFFIFPYIGNNHPNWLMFFRGVQTTNQFFFGGLQSNHPQNLIKGDLPMGISHGEAGTSQGSDPREPAAVGGGLVGVLWLRLLAGPGWDRGGTGWAPQMWSLGYKPLERILTRVISTIKPLIWQLNAILGYPVL